MYVEGPKNKSIDYIDKLKPYINDIKSVYLAGGEPFLDDNVLTLLDLLKNKKEVSIIFTTNCTVDLSNKKIAQKLEKLSRHNVNFNISLDGLPEYNDNIRLGGSFEKVCKKVIAYYMQQAVNNHICTICNLLEKQGHKDLANIIRRI